MNEMNIIKIPVTRFSLFPVLTNKSENITPIIKVNNETL